MRGTGAAERAAREGGDETLRKDECRVAKEVKMLQLEIESGRRPRGGAIGLAVGILERAW